MENAIALFPNFRDAHRNLAILKIQAEEFDEAEEHLTRAIALGSREGLAYGLLAYCHGLKDRPQAALSAYRMALVTMPDEMQWKLGEARMLELLDEPAKASSIYGDLIEKRRGDTGLWINRSSAFSRQEKYDEAIAHLEFAKRIKPLSPTNTFTLGQMYLRKLLPDLALINFQSAIGQIPLDQAVDSVKQLTDFRYYKEAKQLGQKCGELHGAALEKKENQKARSILERSLALVELEAGNAQLGAAKVEKLLERDPLDGDALILLARFRQGEGKPEEAAHLFEQAAGISGFRSKALLEHGKLLVSQYRYSEALKLLVESHELEPSRGLEDYIAAVRDLVRD